MELKDKEKYLVVGFVSSICGYASFNLNSISAAHVHQPPTYPPFNLLYSVIPLRFSFTAFFPSCKPSNSSRVVEMEDGVRFLCNSQAEGKILSHNCKIGDVV